MAVLLDSKDLAALDREYAAESMVWSVLSEGAKNVTDADFVGASEVRINKMSGFCTSDYERNGDNARTKIVVGKETRKLEHQLWMGYDLDALDEGENAGLTVMNVVEEHIRRQSIPAKDKAAVERLVENSGKLMKETVTSANALEAFDAAEQYMVDNEIGGPYVMFASSDYYRALKNSDDVVNTFTTGVADVGGIDRRVSMLDNGIPIVKVPAGRLQCDAGKVINFILMPLDAAAPIEKFNDVTLVPAENDRDGYRDTVKGLNYFDLIVLDNAKKGIYLSYKDPN